MPGCPNGYASSLAGQGAVELALGSLLKSHVNTDIVRTRYFLYDNTHDLNH
jgi:hypothetical protein